MSPEFVPSPDRVRLAEWVLPGHPDRLADTVADTLVDAALERDPEAVVSAGVALYRQRVLLDGCILGRGVTRIRVRELVEAVYREVGFGPLWGPDPASLRVLDNLRREPLDPEARTFRHLACDQSVVVGYACADDRSQFTPVETYLARLLAQELDRLRRSHSELLGPDGKVLLAIRGAPEAPQFESLSVSLQHREDLGDIERLRLLRPALDAWLQTASASWPSLGDTTLDASTLRVNGAGAFTRGGPDWDQGLSGRKLAVDFYGPSSGPCLGGGALTGKDPRKPDRGGALAARRLAKAIVAGGIASEAVVRLAYRPGDPGPFHVEILADGHPLREPLARRWASAHDLTIAGIARLTANWRFAGHTFSGPFADPTAPWERWAT